MRLIREAGLDRERDDGFTGICKIEGDLRIAHDVRRKPLGVLHRDTLRAIDDRDLVLLVPGVPAISRFSSAMSDSNDSRCVRTETYSPRAIERAPATTPARPASRTTLGTGAAPAIPMTRLTFETRPSFAPRTAARRRPEESTLCSRWIAASSRRAASRSELARLSFTCASSPARSWRATSTHRNSALRADGLALRIDHMRGGRPPSISRSNVLPLHERRSSTPTCAAACARRGSGIFGSHHPANTRRRTDTVVPSAWVDRPFWSRA